MAKPADKELGAGGTGELDGTCMQQADTNLAIKKALFESLVMTTVIEFGVRRSVRLNYT